MKKQTECKSSVGANVLNAALLASFVITILVPLTGVHVHKMASVLFLLLCIVHTIAHRKKLGGKKYLLLALVVISFATGLFGMILDHDPMILPLHKVLSIAVVAFLAIHIFVYRKRWRRAV